MSRLDVEHHTAQVENAKATGRWTPSRKASLLALIRSRALTVAQACERFGFSPEEIAEWSARQERFGHGGLKIGQLQTCGHA